MVVGQPQMGGSKPGCCTNLQRPIYTSKPTDPTRTGMPNFWVMVCCASKYTKIKQIKQKKDEVFNSDTDQFLPATQNCVLVVLCVYV